MPINTEAAPSSRRVQTLCGRALVHPDTLKLIFLSMTYDFTGRDGYSSEAVVSESPSGILHPSDAQGVPLQPRVNRLGPLDTERIFLYLCTRSYNNYEKDYDDDKRKIYLQCVEDYP